MQNHQLLLGIKEIHKIIDKREVISAEIVGKLTEVLVRNIYKEQTKKEIQFRFQHLKISIQHSMQIIHSFIMEDRINIMIQITCHAYQISKLMVIFCKVDKILKTMKCSVKYSTR